MVLWINRILSKTTPAPEDIVRIFRFDGKDWYHANAGFFQKARRYLTSRDVVNRYPEGVILISPISNHPEMQTLLENQGF